MAESNPWRHWKTRKIPQVIWVIDEIYNNLWRKTINQQRLQKLGDELDAEKLLQMPKPWSVIKMEKNLTTKLIFQMLKDGSKKNFSTREIFMKWLHDRDRQGLSSIIFDFDEVEKHNSSYIYLLNLPFCPDSSLANNQINKVFTISVKNIITVIKYVKVSYFSEIYINFI